MSVTLTGASSMAFRQSLIYPERLISPLRSGLHQNDLSCKLYVPQSKNCPPDSNTNIQTPGLDHLRKNKQIYRHSASYEGLEEWITSIELSSELLPEQRSLSFPAAVSNNWLLKTPRASPAL